MNTTCTTKSLLVEMMNSDTEFMDMMDIYEYDFMETPDFEEPDNALDYED